jgi:hypothetical protein
MSQRLRTLIGPLNLPAFHRIQFEPIPAKILTIVVIALLAWGAKDWLTAALSRRSISDNKARTSLLSQNNEQKGTPAPSSIKVETLTLRPTGFEPGELTRPAGTFLLAIENHSRFVDAAFELVREDGHKLHEMKGSKGQIRYRKLIDLPPGHYLLKEVNHPEWTCEIVLSH